jgi:hypothetical protein
MGVVGSSTGPPRLELGMPVPKTGVLPITPRAKVCTRLLTLDRELFPSASFRPRRPTEDVADATCRSEVEAAVVIPGAGAPLNRDLGAPCGATKSCHRRLLTREESEIVEEEELRCNQ